MTHKSINYTKTISLTLSVGDNPIYYEKLVVEPAGDQPALELAEKFRALIKQFGWDEFEKFLVADLKLTLVREEEGRRFYEGENGLKITTWQSYGQDLSGNDPLAPDQP